MTNLIPKYQYYKNIIANDLSRRICGLQIVYYNRRTRWGFDYYNATIQE